MEFLKPGASAKIFCEDEDGRHFLGNVVRLHRSTDEYEILDRANGETHYFKNWDTARSYIKRRMRWNAFYVRGKQEVFDDVIFAL